MSRVERPEEVLIGTLKGIYDRARPPRSLMATSGASFPSGHSVAATVTVVAAVIALLAAFAVGELQGRRTAHRAARSAHPPVTGTARPADRR